MHVNKTNSKKYIGITSKSPKTRWRKNGEGYKSSKYFWNAIQKNGWENFEHLILYNDISENEAKDIEKELIKKYKTTNRIFGYNITDGGDGACGVKLSKEQLEYLRGFNIKSVIRFNKNNLNDFKIYESVTSASKDSNITTGMISACCSKKKKSAAGYYWMYYDEYKDKGFDYYFMEPRIRKNSPIHKKVSQYDKNYNFIKTWDSIKDVESECGLDSSSIISVCLGERKTCGGYYWAFYGEDPIFKSTIYTTKKVNQIDPISNQIISTFLNASEASRKLDISGCHIGCVCKGLRETCGGFKWSYA